MVLAFSFICRNRVLVAKRRLLISRDKPFTKNEITEIKRIVFFGY